MSKQEELEKIVKTIQGVKQSSNKDIIHAMDFIREDFEITKNNLIKLTHHLDKLENSYNLLLKEYQTRNNQNGSTS